MASIVKHKLYLLLPCTHNPAEGEEGEEELLKCTVDDSIVLVPVAFLSPLASY